MPSALRPFFADSDQLLLSAQLLLVLEVGRVPMHAADYHELAALAAHELDRLDTDVLHRVRRCGPMALQSIAENLLHDRREPAWSSHGLEQVQAALEWDDLLARLAPAPAGSSDKPSR